MLSLRNLVRVIIVVGLHSLGPLHLLTPHKDRVLEHPDTRS